MLHLEAPTPNGPRRRCHPSFATGGSFGPGISDFLIKLTDPQLRGPAAHWEGICSKCRATLGLDDLLQARRAHIDSPNCRHGISFGNPCSLCETALRCYDDLGIDDVPIEGWQALPFGRAATIGAGQELQFCASPQKIMRGPYRMRLHVEAPPQSWAGGDLQSQLYVQSVQIGNIMLPLAWGEIWGWSFEDFGPNKSVFDRLLPLAGPTLNLGCNINVGLRNAANIAAKVSIVLFGHGLPEREDRSWAPNVPLPRQLGRPDSGDYDPGRPPPLPAHVSVRPRELPEMCDAVRYGQFDDSGDVDAEFERVIADDDPSTQAHARRLLKAKTPTYKSQVTYSRLPPSGPELRPLNALLELGGELFQIKRQVHTSATYGCENGSALASIATVVRALVADKTPRGQPYVSPRFMIEGTEYEVRRYEPPPPPALVQPEVSSEFKRVVAGRLRDRQATIDHLAAQQQVEEAEETAWASASDEWP